MYRRRSQAMSTTLTSAAPTPTPNTLVPTTHARTTLAALAFLASTAFVASPAKADTIPDAESWYRSSYAPLWNDTPASDVDKILAHYAKEIVTHEVDGTISRDEQMAWLAEPMKEWVAEGWLRAELTALSTQNINASTATFIATWTDHYDDGSTEVSCGWYLADYLEQGWIITEYADTGCP